MANNTVYQYTFSNCNFSVLSFNFHVYPDSYVVFLFPGKYMVMIKGRQCAKLNQIHHFLT